MNTQGLGGGDGDSDGDNGDHVIASHIHESAMSSFVDDVGVSFSDFRDPCKPIPLFSWMHPSWAQSLLCRLFIALGWLFGDVRYWLRSHD